MPARTQTGLPGCHVWEREVTIQADISFRLSGRSIFVSALSREARKRERVEKDSAESRGRAEALALELRERKQEAFLLEQRMQRMDAIAKEQRVRQPCSAPMLRSAGLIIMLYTAMHWMAPFAALDGSFPHDDC